MFQSKLAVLIFCLLAFEAIADSAPAKTVKIGLEDRLPVAQKTAYGYSGIAVETLQLMVKEVDQQLQIQFLLASPERLRTELLQGRLDLIYALPSERMRSNAVAVLVPPSRNIVLWSHRDTPILGVDQLQPRELAIASHYLRNPLFENTDPVVVPSSSQLIPMLIAGRVRAIASLDMMLKFRAEAMGYGENDFHQVHLRAIPIVLWTHRHSLVNENMEAWRAAAEKLHRKELLNSRWKKYFRQHSDGRTPLAPDESSAQPKAVSSVSRLTKKFNN